MHDIKIEAPLDKFLCENNQFIRDLIVLQQLYYHKILYRHKRQIFVAELSGWQE